ncbi:MAG: FAD-binding oxidoreductase, partial [Chloroflexi bacterium]|nr:FAD-binding oxidoreductase [Chloroflexota bacterium]
AKTADAVVIGGGVIGASLAFYLSKAGLKVTLVEKKHLGYGGTGASTAIIRMHYDNAPETRLAVASYPVWANWADNVGSGDPDFEKRGVLWLVGEADAEKMQKNVTMHRAVGAKTQIVTPDVIERIEPALDTTNVALAAWEPQSGWADPLAATSGFAEAAHDKGAEVELDTTVVDVILTAGRVVGVRTDRGFVDTPVVVNAAGPWAGRIAQMVHLDLPINVERRQIAVFDQPPDVPRQSVAVVDQVTGIYFRPDSAGAIQVGMNKRGDEVNPDEYNRAPDPDFADTVKRLLSARLSAMDRGEFRAGWSGLVDMTPDGKAILGAAGPHGFYLACGFSGTGFNFAPAVGLCLTELIVGGQAKTVDIEPFRLSRFAEGRPIRGEWEYEGGGGFEQRREAREL